MQIEIQILKVMLKIFMFRVYLKNHDHKNKTFLTQAALK